MVIKDKRFLLCLSGTYFVLLSCRSCAGFLLVSCRFYAAFVLVLCRSCAAFVPVLCRYLADPVSVSCSFRAGLMLPICRFYARAVYAVDMHKNMIQRTNNNTHLYPAVQRWVIRTRLPKRKMMCIRLALYRSLWLFATQRLCPWAGHWWRRATAVEKPQVFYLHQDYSIPVS